ncbi:hypothetical protein ABE073_04995 [Lederbergia citrisecunda]|uniref:hypothetical protein n=1 Tax=Lederbergia citrisecunda TaxID=2833583 RepID=UPI003D2A36B4
MNTILMDTINLSVFDEDGKLITKIKTAKGASLRHNDRRGDSYLIIDDVLLNLKMLEAISEKEERKSLNDFDKVLQSSSEETVLKFKQRISDKEQPKFKLIGEGILYSPETSTVSHDFKIIVQEAIYVNGLEMEFENREAFTPSYSFKLLPYNDEKDVFDLRLKERK